MKFFSVKIRTRIFLTYLIISTICFYYPFRWVLDTMRTRYLEAVEDPLVDQAEILAAMVGAQMTAGDFAVEQWANIFARSYQKELRAQIYDLEKRAVDILVYLTDDAGTVLFHSTDPDQVGADFSSWRDVSLTLAGSYGARASRGGVVADDVMVMYVGAPIMVNNQVVGVLSVGKPTTNISWFVEHAKLKVLLLALLALGLNALFGFLAARWLTQPINRLTAYARRIKGGERPPFPQLGSSEIGAMGRAFEEMQEALEGKRYVETYIQHLTHEIKSPISAIQGAAELLQEPMDDEQRHRFLGNIEREAHRMQAVVERMLELAALENQKTLMKAEWGAVDALIDGAVERVEQAAAAKELSFAISVAPGAKIYGDQLLLHQALVNLLQNSVDFSPRGAVIAVSCTVTGSVCHLRVADQGPGIAEFAKERVFEKFFSLQRPDTGQKSTGLGLNFVQQVALLHGGTISFADSAGRGATAVLRVAVP
jgi:two-component system sensor histidine kinase CreC